MKLLAKSEKGVKKAYPDSGVILNEGILSDSFYTARKNSKGCLVRTKTFEW